MHQESFYRWVFERDSVEAKYVSAYLEHLKELAATGKIRSGAHTIKNRDRA